jgi:hypothetical protein
MPLFYERFFIKIGRYISFDRCRSWQVSVKSVNKSLAPPLRNKTAKSEQRKSVSGARKGLKIISVRLEPAAVTHKI